MTKKEQLAFQELKSENESLREEIKKLQNKAEIKEYNEIKKFYLYEKKDYIRVNEYSAGTVYEEQGVFQIAYQQSGAEATFCVGMPVFDQDKNLMGYLGIGLYENLDMHTDCGLRIPGYYWSILQPTEFCKEGKKVFTYYQNKEV